jgi:hypothetical protein
MSHKNLINEQSTYTVFGIREIQKRETAKRERGERETTSLVWNSGEEAKREKICVGPALFPILSKLRRKEMEETCFQFYP